MSEKKKSEGTELGLKIVITIAVVIFVIWILWNIVVSMIPTVGGSFGAGMPGPSKGSHDDRIVITNAKPQIIYRLDEHRFLTLENYIACDKSGQVYYNDTSLGIKSKLDVFAAKLGEDWGGEEQIQLKDSENMILSYKGFLLNKSTNGNLAFPYIDNTWSFCNNNYGCYRGALVSTDQGKTFEAIDYERRFSGPTEEKVVLVGNDFYYVGDVNDSSQTIKKISLNHHEPVREDVSSAVMNSADFKNEKFDVKFTCNPKIKPSSVKFTHRKNTSK
ncbi:T6SS immunity protein Tli3 family protein [Rahnella selenatireducens]|uniref:T6SS immunity protein Tli3 family protein n=1 Tax=Rahnella selenatireducens TaxID=3389797 RepID=UPI00396984C1